MSARLPPFRPSLVSRALWPWLLAATLACTKRDDSAGTLAATGGPQTKSSPMETAGSVNDGQAAPARPAPLEERLLHWLDPDAPAALFARVDDTFDPAKLAIVYALPPRAEQLLHAAMAVKHDLEVLSEPDTSRVVGWLGKATVVLLPLLSKHPYVVRHVTAPRSKVEAALRDFGLTPHTRQGFELFEGTRSFPWRLTFLEDDLLGFIPRDEPGTGLNPFTAGRDLPRKELGQELARESEDREAIAVLVTLGPLLHYDLEQELLGFRFSLRKKGDRYDGSTAFSLARDLEAARGALEARKLPEESDRIQAIADNVAYVVDGPLVRGRLEFETETAHDLRR